MYKIIIVPLEVMLIQDKSTIYLFYNYISDLEMFYHADTIIQWYIYVTNIQNPCLIVDGSSFEKRYWAPHGRRGGAAWLFL